MVFTDNHDNQGGQVTLTVPSMQAAALHTGAPCDPGTTPPVEGDASVAFQCQNGNTAWGQSVYVTGNNDTLGNWSPAAAVKLDAATYPTWSGTLALPANTSIEWKCIKRSETDPGAQLEWQSGANNQVQTGEDGSTSATSGSF